ncbi:phage tail protein [Klebsiella quasipneumoniae]|uniref:phage tail protein n=1 Tax=Klebsiella quasipneumoniae TaxID=1463165 RepID=UPI001CFE5AB5|nr:phage tail protein [Klebsiella quasipneumoniae]
MTAKYFAILTNQGAARLANAAALGTKLNLTQMAVGDANGTLPTPDPSQTKLINQKRIAPLNLLTVDPANTSQIIAEQIIPENEGGFWIREIGLYDDDGILIAVANCPETYKPQLQEGSGRTQTIRMILIVSSTSAITLKIDPAVVLATRQYVDDKIIEVKGYADDLMKKHVEAANPHKQYPLIANALKEMVDAGLAGDVLKNLGLVGGLASDAVGRLIGVKIITASTTYAATPGTKKVLAIITGGGGGGGSCHASSTANTFSGAGGGAAGTCIGLFNLSDITNKAITIGAGGIGQTDGGNTTFAGMVAGGGEKGNWATSTSTPGGSGGTATGGILNIPGGMGNDGQAGAYLINGSGGGSLWGSGGRSGQGGGIGAPAYGAGGGGAYDTAFTNTTYQGGNGAPGVALILEFA